ncbi:hypothetical protein Tco_0210550 [Tanacetum coccineum]
MSNSNTNLQTQSSNALHNAIMEAGSKDRPPMLAPGNYVQWKSRIKRYIDTKPNSELIHYCLQNPPYTYQWAEKTVPVAEGSSETTTERYMENYKNVSQDIRDQLNAEAEAVQIILTGIDNDIYSTVDACPNACEMWKAIERLKQGESINFLLQLQPEWQRSQQSTRNRGKAIVTSSAPTYDPEPNTVTEDDEMSKDKEIDKLMALISLSFKKIYKPTNNNIRTSSNSSRANQDNSPRINRGTGRKNKAFETDDESDDQNWKAPLNVQGTTSRGYSSERAVRERELTNIWIDDPMHKRNIVTPNITIDSLDICYDRVQDDQDDTDDLDQERDFLASLIQKTKNVK